VSEVYARVITKKIQEVCIPNPTNLIEVNKAIGVVDSTIRKNNIANLYDDTVMVRANDEEIIFYFEIPE